MRIRKTVDGSLLVSTMESHRCQRMNSGVPSVWSSMRSVWSVNGLGWYLDALPLEFY